MKKKLIIFDLDGTLLNTIADLANATNYALTHIGYSTHPTEAYKLFVGNGVRKLFERTLPEGSKTLENINKMVDLFMPYYDTNNTVDSSPYEGILTLLDTLQEQGYMLAVASNKYQSATEKLVKHYFPNINFIAVFGQREGINPKPDPTIVHDIISIAKVNRDEILYIGDSGVDIQTANNAGIDSCGVTWGFRPKEELAQFSPKYIVDKVYQIDEILKSL